MEEKLTDMQARGRRLTKARQSKFRFARDAAQELNVTTAAYHKHEREGFNSIDQARTYADFFDVDFLWLARGIDPSEASHSGYATPIFMARVLFQIEQALVDNPTLSKIADRVTPAIKATALVSLTEAVVTWDADCKATDEEAIKWLIDELPARLTEIVKQHEIATKISL